MASGLPSMATTVTVSIDDVRSVAGVMATCIVLTMLVWWCSTRCSGGRRGSEAEKHFRPLRAPAPQRPAGFSRGDAFVLDRARRAGVLPPEGSNSVRQNGHAEAALLRSIGSVEAPLHVAAANDLRPKHAATRTVRRAPAQHVCDGWSQPRHLETLASEHAGYVSAWDVWPPREALLDSPFGWRSAYCEERVSYDERGGGSVVLDMHGRPSLPLRPLVNEPTWQSRQSYAACAPSPLREHQGSMAAGEADSTYYSLDLSPLAPSAPWEATAPRATPPSGAGALLPRGVHMVQYAGGAAAETPPTCDDREMGRLAPSSSQHGRSRASVPSRASRLPVPSRARAHTASPETDEASAGFESRPRLSRSPPRVAMSSGEDESDHVQAPSAKSAANGHGAPVAPEPPVPELTADAGLWPLINEGLASVRAPFCSLRPSQGGTTAAAGAGATGTAGTVTGIASASPLASPRLGPADSAGGRAGLGAAHRHSLPPAFTPATSRVPPSMSNGGGGSGGGSGGGGSGGGGGGTRGGAGIGRYHCSGGGGSGTSSGGGGSSTCGRKRAVADVSNGSSHLGANGRGCGCGCTPSPRAEGAAMVSMADWHKVIRLQSGAPVLYDGMRGTVRRANPVRQTYAVHLLDEQRTVDVPFGSDALWADVGGGEPVCCSSGRAGASGGARSSGSGGSSTSKGMRSAANPCSSDCFSSAKLMHMM